MEVSDRGGQRMLEVIAPCGVEWNTMPMILDFLYSDSIDLSNNTLSISDPEHAIACALHNCSSIPQKDTVGTKKNRKETESKSAETTKSKSKSKSANTTKAHQRYVALFDLNFAEKLMCSANVLQLPSLLELVELQCSKIICAANVERIATIAERVNAIQLLNAAVRSKLKIEI